MLKSSAKRDKMPQFLHAELQEKPDVSPENVYYDLVITNLYSSRTVPPVLYFNEIRNSPLIQCAGDYRLSILRFQLDTQTIPVFAPIIQPSQPDINKTIYSVTMSYMGVDSDQTFLIWEPQDSASAIPPAPSSTANGFQVSSTGYYNAYNYQWFIYLVTQTLANALTNLATKIVLPTAQPPIMTWDTQNKIAIINAESAYFEIGLANPIKIYFNASLYTLFSTFVARYEGYTQPNGKNFLLAIEDFSGTNTISLPTSAPPASQYIATQVFQESSTISSWNPVASIVFCSNTIPIVPNQLSAPLVISDQSSISSVGSGNNSNFQQVITDFVADVYVPSIIYTPTAQFRYIDMYGNLPLSQFDLSVFYKSRVGELIPFTISSGGSCNIKVMFEKKKK